jgi:DNA-binding CsgD family transcriptional regulator
MQSSKTQKCLADRAVGNTANGVWIVTVHKLSSRDLRNLLGAVSILNESLDLETLPQRTTAAVTRVLPSDMVTYNEVDLVRRTDRIFVTPDEVRLAAGTLEYASFMRHIDQHPVIAHNACIADPVPRKISDFLSNRRLRSLGLHAEFFRAFDVNYQMSLVILHAGQQMIGVAANRALSDFTERERTCLAALRPHVVQSYRHGLMVEEIRAQFRIGREPRADAAGGLTQREAEVLHWVAGGKSNDDVARIVGATSATVKKHLENIYDKLGVANRTAASAVYIRAHGTLRPRRLD